MIIRPISEWTLYKHRFLIAYSGLAVMVALLLTLYPNNLPPGLSSAEQQSIIDSHGLSFTQLPSAAQVVNLPFHALQKVTVDFLGVTPFGVRLPSLFFGALTILCLSFVIKRWFKINVAIVATMIIITSTWFLSLARLGTPDIMIPFWTSCLILCATYVSQQTKHWQIWKGLFGVSAALALYTPYMAYLFAATLIAAIAQPHLRYLIRQSSKVGLTIGTFFFLLLLVPLGWGVYKDPTLLREILAIPATIPEPLQFGRDILQALSNLLYPFNLSARETITPLLNIATATLVVIGGFRLLSDFHSVRAYVLLIWMALLVPIIGFAPQNLTVLFVPAMLVMTIGLNLIVRYWYKLFPINPYARIFGLLPLFILIFSVMQFGYQRYTFTMLYSIEAGQTFNPDGFLAQSMIKQVAKNVPITLVVAPKDKAFYQVIADSHPETVVITGDQSPIRQSAYLVAENQVAAVPQLGTALKLIISDRKDDALRFRFYQ
ncbi:MAG TPA: glycosyltransferase family 39 protein [Magnetospirillaceae bacterium]|nr:glycosyltransferase family 39 protein [Magnetospirillaceae bacterium]